MTHFLSCVPERSGVESVVLFSFAVVFPASFFNFKTWRLFTSAYVDSLTVVIWFLICWRSVDSAGIFWFAFFSRSIRLFFKLPSLLLITRILSLMSPFWARFIMSLALLVLTGHRSLRPWVWGLDHGSGECKQDGFYGVVSSFHSFRNHVDLSLWIVRTIVEYYWKDSSGLVVYMMW